MRWWATNPVPLVISQIVLFDRTRTWGGLGGPLPPHTSTPFNSANYSDEHVCECRLRQRRGIWNLLLIKRLQLRITSSSLPRDQRVQFFALPMNFVCIAILYSCGFCCWAQMGDDDVVLDGEIIIIVRSNGNAIKEDFSTPRADWWTLLDCLLIFHTYSSCLFICLSAHLHLADSFTILGNE